MWLLPYSTISAVLYIYMTTHSDTHKYSSMFFLSYVRLGDMKEKKDLCPVKRNRSGFHPSSLSMQIHTYHLFCWILFLTSLQRNQDTIFLDIAKVPQSSKNGGEEVRSSSVKCKKKERKKKCKKERYLFPRS